MIEVKKKIESEEYKINFSPTKLFLQNISPTIHFPYKTFPLQNFSPKKFFLKKLSPKKLSPPKLSSAKLPLKKLFPYKTFPYKTLFCTLHSHTEGVCICQFGLHLKLVISAFCCIKIVKPCQILWEFQKVSFL